MPNSNCMALDELAVDQNYIPLSISLTKHQISETSLYRPGVDLKLQVFTKVILTHASQVWQSSAEINSHSKHFIRRVCFLQSQCGLYRQAS